MKKILTIVAILGAFNSFAGDIDGVVRLNGVKYTLSIDENQVSLGNKKFAVNIFNDSNIVAANGTTEITILHGDAMKSILKKKVDVVGYFGLQNGKEINCTASSKAFVVVADENSALGNCIN